MCVYIYTTSINSITGYQYFVLIWILYASSWLSQVPFRPFSKPPDFSVPKLLPDFKMKEMDICTSQSQSLQLCTPSELFLVSSETPTRQFAKPKSFGFLNFPPSASMHWPKQAMGSPISTDRWCPAEVPAG